MAIDTRYFGSMTNFRRGLPPSMKEIRLSEDARQADNANALAQAELLARLEMARMQDALARDQMNQAVTQQAIADANALRAGSEQAAMQNAAGVEAFNRQALGSVVSAAQAAQAARNEQAMKDRLAGRYAADTRSANVALGQGDYNNFNELAARSRALSARLGIAGSQGQLGVTGQLQERARLGNRENALISTRDRFQLQVDEARAMAEQARAAQMQAALKMRGMQ